jgi:uncharacterized damage-inducible protein DinB
MKEAILDLFRHQEWADAGHWRAVRACPAAAGDKALFDRLHHIHLVQRAFLWAWEGGTGPFTVTKPKDFASLDALRDFAREYHGRVHGVLEAIAPGRLDDRVVLPWLEPIAKAPLRVGESMLHAAMHSHYHRAQNATRLRELGGEPPQPSTDFVLWVVLGKPQASW